MAIEYAESVDGLTVEDLAGGFFAGWPSPPAPEAHLRILHGSDHVVVARDRDRVVGFVNALSDGGYMAYIPLLEVLPQYRAAGIGTELVRRLRRRLAGHYHVALLCDAAVQPFYARLDAMAVPGMVFLDLDRQGGVS